jgi:hypothetical protein
MIRKPVVSSHFWGSAAKSGALAAEGGSGGSEESAGLEEAAARLIRHGCSPKNLLGRFLTAGRLSAHC